MEKMEIQVEQEIVSYVDDRLKQAENKPYRMQAYLNIAYFAGKQWVAFDKVNSRLFEPPKEPWQVRYVSNRVQPIVRTELAKITKNKFIMIVVPASNDDEDIKSARVGEKVTEWLEYELNLNEKDQENGLWGLTTSISFVHPYWNPSKGLSIPDPETKETVKQGDVDCDIVSMFELRWDSTASKWDEVKWCCYEKIRDVNYVKKVYDVEVTPEANVFSTNIFEAQLRDLNTLGQGAAYKPAENSVIVKEFWELPSTEYPNGRRITVAGGKVLFYDEDIGFGPDDETERELPFFPFFHIQVPGRVMPTCVVEQLIPVQREYNKSRSQIIENKNLMSNPVWLVPKGSLEEDPTNMPGAVYEYNFAMGKPEMLTPPSTGVDVYKNIDICVEEFDYISGQHEVSHGSAPPGVKSGVAINFLQEQDDTKLGPTISNFIKCKQKYMRYLLKMLQKKYDVARTLKLVGKNKKIETFEFKGSDLTSIDVRIQEASMYQMSRAAKQDWIMQLVQNGVLDPAKDKALIIKMLELGITDDMYDDYEIDINQAQNEQDNWKKKNFNTPVRDFYNHAVHVNEHNKFRKSDDYTGLPVDEQKQIDAHVQQHLEFEMKNVVPNAPPQQPQQGIDVNNAINQLTPEERQALQQNPGLIDKAVSNMNVGK